MKRKSETDTSHINSGAFIGSPSNSSSQKNSRSSNGELLLTRRHFLYGAMGVGVLAAALGNSLRADIAYAADEEIAYLEVPEDAVFSLNECTELAPASDYMALVGNFELPYGTLLWASGDTIAACLLPTETAKPLTQAALLFLGSGNYTTILEAAIGQDKGFDIYDIRACDKGIIWTEANILSGIWNIYTATFDGNVIGEPLKVDEGNNDDWETPTIAAVGTHAFWQVLPNPNGSKKTESSLLKRSTFGKPSSDIIYTSSGRMCTPIYPLKDSLVITPRTNTDSIHYQLTLLDAATGETKDKLVLPSSMKPLEAGYGNTGFNFAFDGIYNYGDGIANLGTYTPQSSKAINNYVDQTWFRFSKTPSAPPCWCKDFFMVKSTRAVCGVNLNDRTYFAFDVESGSDSYGDYLASTGMNGSVVTYANINAKSIEGKVTKCCLVRVWAPYA